MVEEVLFETESTIDRAAVADYLRTVADGLEQGSELTLTSGEQELSVDPPEQVTFEVKAEREHDGGPSELSLEFELEWVEGESTTGGGELDISAEDL